MHFSGARPGIVSASGNNIMAAAVNAVAGGLREWKIWTKFIVMKLPKTKFYFVTTFDKLKKSV